MFQCAATRFVVTGAERVLALLLMIAVLLYCNLSRMPYGLTDFLLERITVVNVLAAGAFLAAWSFFFAEIDKPPMGRFPIVKVLANTIKASSAVTVIVGALLLGAKVQSPLEKVLPLFWLLSTMLGLLRVLITWMIEHSPFQEKNRVLILGTGPMARRVWRELRTRYHRTAEVHGFVDTGCLPSAMPEVRSKYLGNVEELETLLLRNVIDAMIVAMPARSCYGAIQKAITIAEEVGVELIQFEPIFQLKGAPGHVLLAPFDFRPDSPAQLFAQFIKRAFDVTVAVTGIILLFPILLTIALAIRLTSPGPAFFVQERYGHRRRKFKLLKFRTMVRNAEQLMQQLESQNEAVGPIFKIKNDPRITPLGRFLRKTSFDELPQLWNVLVGHMSLVGPRPMSLRDVDKFSSSYLMRRFRVKPGITGLWQVNGRSNTTFDHWISMDFRYIDQWSLLLDFKILLRTIPAVLKGSGAM